MSEVRERAELMAELRERLARAADTLTAHIEAMDSLKAHAQKLTGIERQIAEPAGPGYEGYNTGVITAAISIIGAWEGNTYNWHGGGTDTYGILGFRGDWLDKVVRKAGLTVRPEDADYRQTLSEAADKPEMQEAQRAIAAAYLQRAWAISCKPRNLNTPLGQLMVMDAAVNHGLYHEILQETEARLGLTHKRRVDDEEIFIRTFAQARIDLRRHLYAQYPGLRVRYDWWQLLTQKSFDLAWNLPNFYIAPKGLTIKLTNKIQGTYFNPRTTISSPVEQYGEDLLPDGWKIALGFNRPFDAGKWFGPDWDTAYHSGADFSRSGRSGTTYGQPVYAICSGEVRYASHAKYGWGGLVIVENDADFSHARYGHLAALYVRVGDRVNAGEQIGTIGTGEPLADGRPRYGAHLHLDFPRDISNPTQRSYAATQPEISERFWNPATHFNYLRHKLVDV